MTDSRRERALTAARIRLRSPVPRPLLDETRIDEVCAELLALEAELESLLHPVDWLNSGHFIPKHAADCRDLNCDRSCMAATSPETALPATNVDDGGSGHG